VDYFEAELKDGVVMLKPLRIYDTSLKKVRSKNEKARSAGKYGERFY
jgi:hypothetical protein